MFCPKCGQPAATDDDFCKKCGNDLKKATTISSDEQAKVSKTSITLLGIGAAVAIVICAISIGAYGRIYFFDGFAITKIAWILAIGCTICGLAVFLKDLSKLKVSSLFKNDKKGVVIATLLIIVIPAIFLYSSFGKTGNSSENNNYYNTPEDYQNAFESCHSTYEHKQALYSYDLNNDNYLSEYELQLFANAHPRFVQDKAFVAWVEDMLGD